MILAVIVAKQLADDQVSWQIVMLVVGYLAHYFVFELLLSSSSGKLMNGLVVRDFRGGRCAFGQTAVRTLMRLVEANPVLFGGVPAVVSIRCTRNKQRIGDKLARSVVVRR